MAPGGEDSLGTRNSLLEDLDKIRMKAPRLGQENQQELAVMALQLETD